MLEEIGWGIVGIIGNVLENGKRVRRWMTARQFFVGVLKSFMEEKRKVRKIVPSREKAAKFFFMSAETSSASVVRRRIR